MLRSQMACCASNASIDISRNNLNIGSLFR